MYRVIDAYYRQPIFDYYRRVENPFYSLTCELDAAPLKRFLDQHGYPVYVNLCYFFTRAAQPLVDFRYRLLGERIVLYDELHPGLTYPAANGLFSFVHLVYDADVARFNRAAVEAVPDRRAPARLDTTEHTNYLYFTAIPDVPFTSFTHATDGPTDGAPRVAFGQLVADGTRLRLPVGIQVNHLFIDGRALGELYERARDLFSDPAEIL